MSLRYFRLNMFAFIINNLKMVLSHLTVARVTHNHIIMVMGAALNGLIVSDAKSIATGAERYFIIEETSFAFRKKFTMTSNMRRYYSYRK